MTRWRSPDNPWDVSAAVLERRPGLTQMQLHKLLYLVQAASLAWFDVEAFEGPIQAWRWGPMVPRVNYREFDNAPIPEPKRGRSSMVDARTLEIVDQIVAEYGHLSGPALARLVKREGSPWRTARGDIPTSDDSDAEISAPSIREYHRHHGITWVRPTTKQRRLAKAAKAGDDDAMADLFQSIAGTRPRVS